MPLNRAQALSLLKINLGHYLSSSPEQKKQLIDKHVASLAVSIQDKRLLEEIASAASRLKAPEPNFERGYTVAQGKDAINAHYFSSFLMNLLGLPHLQCVPRPHPRFKNLAYLLFADASLAHLPQQHVTFDFLGLPLRLGPSRHSPFNTGYYYAIEKPAQLTPAHLHTFAEFHNRLGASNVIIQTTHPNTPLTQQLIAFLRQHNINVTDTSNTAVPSPAFAAAPSI